MLTLYVKTGCPYCAKVHMTAAALGVTFTEKNIADGTVREELKEGGGKVQVPYLIDEENGTRMYESDDINAYLHEKFGKGHV